MDRPSVTMGKHDDWYKYALHLEGLIQMHKHVSNSSARGVCIFCGEHDCDPCRKTCPTSQMPRE